MKATIGARGGAEALARVHGCVGMEEWFRPHTLTKHGPNPITGLDSDATVVYRFGIDAWGWAWSCGGKGKGRGVTTPPSPPPHTTPNPTHHPIATWLILPVVICLSQRLSHACPSISDFTVKLRKAH